VRPGRVSSTCFFPVFQVVFQVAGHRGRIDDGVHALLFLFVDVDPLAGGIRASGADGGGDFLLEAVVVVAQDLALPAGILKIFSTTFTARKTR
jgi:hypothetical protein